jgi:hypothetical protein
MRPTTTAIVKSGAKAQAANHPRVNLKAVCTFYLCPRDIKSDYGSRGKGNKLHWLYRRIETSEKTLCHRVRTIELQNSITLRPTTTTRPLSPTVKEII